ncbi:MAG: uncharacterized protein KVP18_002656 [Porospora cf. gigantea A]|uniref:uncharacterized protein n=2 Tax=Porospora cf. gigantea A TaxID=2853593 RepID=UPI0035597146|nr:MAG: hypothetical protein KVP18_002656 [Porospora cf. gigantea A]
MLQPELKGEAPRDSFDRPTRSRGIGRGFPLRNGSDSASPRSDGSRSSGPEDSYGILGLPFIAMDLEGVHLSREGKLCLVQLCLGDDIYTAYVLDVVSLGPVETFSVATPRGTTLRSALEDPNVCKLCFDPRKDVDALYHQSGVLINGAFDLQLAEVAVRRSQLFNVKYLKSLPAVLLSTDLLNAEEQAFASRVVYEARSMFNDCRPASIPGSGSPSVSYESTPRGPVIDFNIRPLHPTLLTYAAHDVHYMFQLYVFLVEQLSVGWCKAVFRETARRCQSYADEDPNENSPYAPAFYA